MNVLGSEKLEIQKNTEVVGVLLSGGLSLRMKSDKSALEYHGIPQGLHALNLLKSVCSRVVVSCRENQKESFSSYNCELIFDKVTGMGPMAGIMEVFKSNPNCTLMILATDLPFVSLVDLEFLLNERDFQKQATCFVNPENALPEPLVSIWEPHIFKQALDLVSRGITCPRKILMNLDVKLVTPLNLNSIRNINTPDERIDAVQFLSKQKLELNGVGL
jgi:molybdenum cofactor guanylyltransferase